VSFAPPPICRCPIVSPSAVLSRRRRPSRTRRRRPPPHRRPSKCRSGPPRPLPRGHRRR
jgi:hypothetical protein